MSIRSQFAALGGALYEDVRSLTPYAMAKLTGYGRVGGYARDYLELKRDCLEYFDLCAEVLGDGPVRRARRLPQLRRRRLMAERFFVEERDSLRDALGGALGAMKRSPAAAWDETFTVAHPELGDRFRYLINRAGVPTPRRAPAQRMRALPPPQAAAQTASSQSARSLADAAAAARRATRPIGAAGGGGVIQLAAAERQLATDAMLASKNAAATQDTPGAPSV